MAGSGDGERLHGSENVPGKTKRFIHFFLDEPEVLSLVVAWGCSPIWQTGRGAQRNDLFQGMMEFAPHVHGWPNTYKPGYLESLPPPAEEDWHVGISPRK